MKKILSLFAAVLLAGSVWGLEVTYDFTSSSNYPTGFPTSTKNTCTTETAYTFNGNTISFKTANSGTLYQTSLNGEYSIFLGKNVKLTDNGDISVTAYMKIPGKVNHRITKIVVTNAANAAYSKITYGICNASYELVTTAQQPAVAAAVANCVNTFNINTTGTTLGVNEAAYLTYAPTCTAGKSMNVRKIVVTYTPVVTLSTAQYATYYNASDAFTMPAGLEGIVVDAIDGNSLDLTAYYSANDVVPAGEPLILHATTELSEETTFTLNIATASGASLKSTGENLLSGTSTANEMTTGGAPYYRLSQHDGVVGFYYGAADGAAFQPGANKAYLALNGAAAAPERFVFNQTPVATGVENVATVKATKALVNGQLVIVRNGAKFNVNGMLVK